MISLIYCRIHCLYLPIFYLVSDFIHLNFIRKPSVVVISFLSLKGITHTYFNIRILNPLLHLFINCISARSAPQILPIKGEYTFLFLNCLIIGLCNSSANSLLNIISFLTVPPEVFYQKNYKPFK